MLRVRDAAVGEEGKLRKLGITRGVAATRGAQEEMQTAALLRTARPGVSPPRPRNIVADCRALVRTKGLHHGSRRA